MPISGAQGNLHRTAVSSPYRFNGIRQDGIHPSSNLLLIASVRANTVSSLFEGLQPNLSSGQTIHTGPSMVDIQRQILKLDTNTQKGNKQHNANRCLPNRLGSSTCKARSCGFMVSRGKEYADKSTRTKGYSVRSQAICQTAVTPTNTNGQQICYPIC